MATVIDTDQNDLSLSTYKRWFREWASAKEGEIIEAASRGDIITATSFRENSQGT